MFLSMPAQPTMGKGCHESVFAACTCARIRWKQPLVLPRSYSQTPFVRSTDSSRRCGASSARSSPPSTGGESSRRLTGETMCFRDAFEAAQELLQADPKDRLRKAPTNHDQSRRNLFAAKPFVLRGFWDGEMLAELAAHVEGAMREGAKTLGLHLYSNATVLSSSRAVSAYPLLMRVVNINTSADRFVTVACIPQVEGMFLETRKGQ